MRDPLPGEAGLAKDMGADPLIRSTAARLRQLEEIRLQIAQLEGSQTEASEATAALTENMMTM